MPRYQINIGSDFPVEQEGERHASRRFGRFRYPPFGPAGALVRALFAVSLVVLTITHPVHAAVILGAVLLLGRVKVAASHYHAWHHRLDHDRRDRNDRGWRRSRGTWDRDFERGAFV